MMKVLIVTGTRARIIIKMRLFQTPSSGSPAPSSPRRSPGPLLPRPRRRLDEGRRQQDSGQGLISFLTLVGYFLF